MFIIVVLCSLAMIHNSHASQYETMHKKLFCYIEKSSSGSWGNFKNYCELQQFLIRYAEETEEEEFNVEQDRLSLTNPYYVLYQGPRTQPLMALAYACNLVTCDADIVSLLCAFGANPNYKNDGGLFPATCCLQGLIRLYKERDMQPPHIHSVANQVQKFVTLYNFVQERNKIPSDHAIPHPITVEPLAVDNTVKEKLTNDIREWLKGFTPVLDLSKNVIFCD